MKCGWVQTEFKRFDPQSYIVDANDKSFVCRPRLRAPDWNASNWLCLEIQRHSYTQKSITRISNQIASYLNDGSLIGKCYPAVQTLFCLMDTRKLQSFRGKDTRGEYHWWLVDIETDKIFDPTVAQYDELGIQPPYADGKKCSWYGFRPFIQKRSMDVIHQLQPSSKFHKVTDLSELKNL